MTRHIRIVCLVCKELVDVHDNTIAEHGTCPASGLGYIPSPRGFRLAGPGSPRVEIVAGGPMNLPCNCGESHQGIGALLKVSVPKFNVN